MGEEGKDEINDQLGAEIDQHQKSEQGIGNSVQGAKGQKQEWGEIANNGHGDVGGVARPGQAQIGVLHNVNPLFPKSQLL